MVPQTILYPVINTCIRIVREMDCIHMPFTEIVHVYSCHHWGYLHIVSGDHGWGGKEGCAGNGILCLLC